jgi:hypothetical protein
MYGMATVVRLVSDGIVVFNPANFTERTKAFSAFVCALPAYLSPVRTRLLHSLVIPYAYTG